MNLPQAWLKNVPVLNVDFTGIGLLDEVGRVSAVSKRRVGLPTRNRRRFPADFAFQLTAEEFASLATLKPAGRGQHRKYLPWVFTELTHRSDASASIVRRMKHEHFH